jgi:hypothetical protein
VPASIVALRLRGLVTLWFDIAAGAEVPSPV